MSGCYYYFIFLIVWPLTSVIYIFFSSGKESGWDIVFRLILRRNSFNITILSHYDWHFMLLFLEHFSIGVVVIPAAFIGTLSGGFIIRAFNLQNKGKAMMILVLHIGCFFTTIMYLFIGCPNTPTAGLTAPYESRDSYSSSYVA